jgi:hypothetical protein
MRIADDGRQAGGGGAGKELVTDPAGASIQCEIGLR